MCAPRFSKSESITQVKSFHFRKGENCHPKIVTYIKRLLLKHVMIFFSPELNKIINLDVLNLKNIAQLKLLKLIAKFQRKSKKWCRPYN